MDNEVKTDKIWATSLTIIACTLIISLSVYYSIKWCHPNMALEQLEIIRRASF